MTSPNLINDRYQIIRSLGRGGLGQTYLARDIVQAVNCALKEFAPGPTISATNLAKAQQLFQREAKVLRQLSHPQIPAYLDSFAWRDRADGSDRLFLVQQYIDGDTYQHHLQRRPFTEAQTLQFLQDMLPLLAYLHSHDPQVIHRDIAPDNLIFDPELGKPVLIDFGSVKQAIAIATQESQATSNPAVKAVRTIISKQGFTAPEQVHGIAYASSDIYALGMSAIALLTGSTNPSELAPHQWQAGLTNGFARLIQRMAHPVANQRFADAGAVLAEIQALSQPGQSAPTRMPLFPSGPKTRLQKLSPYELKPEAGEAMPPVAPAPGQAQPIQAQSAPVQASPIQASPIQASPIQASPAQPTQAPYAVPAASQPVPVTQVPANQAPANQALTNQAPASIAKTIAVGSPLKAGGTTQPVGAGSGSAGGSGSATTFTSGVEEIYPWYLLPFVKTQGVWAFLLYRVVAPGVALLCLFGLGRAAVLRVMLPQVERVGEQVSWPQLPQVKLPRISLPEFSLPERSAGSSGADCRAGVVERADAFEAERGESLNWGEVDRRFRYANPGFTEAIDPENPEHGPYIESWCGVANDWLDEQG